MSVTHLQCGSHQATHLQPVWSIECCTYPIINSHLQITLSLVFFSYLIYKNSMKQLDIFSFFLRKLKSDVTKYHRLGSRNNRNIFSQFWRLEVQDHGVSRVGSLRAVKEGSLPGLCLWLVDDCLLPLYLHCLPSYTSV